jgi:lysyl-tRNA synthetase class 2
LGRIIFCVLKDSSGKIQIVFQENKTPEEKIDFFKKYIDSGDFIGLEGRIIKTKTGEKSVLVKEIELLRQIYSSIT